MTRLDFLPNPPLERDIVARFLEVSHPNPSPMDPKNRSFYDASARALGTRFGAQEARSFDYTSGSFLELCLYFSLQGRRIALASSLHHNATATAPLLERLGYPCHWLIPAKESGIIELQAIEEARQAGCDLFILPLVNEDILTQNPVESYPLGDSLVILEASYPLALGLPLPDIHAHWLINGEILGLWRGMGAILSPEPLPTPEPLLRPELFNALTLAIERRESLAKKVDQKGRFFALLQDHLGEDVSLFAPLPSLLPNTLPLRLRDIRARSLLQSLLLDNISALNGQACLFGFFKPSAILQSMGYEEEEARELLSLSFQPLEEVELARLAELIALRYKQVNLYR